MFYRTTVQEKKVELSWLKLLKDDDDADDMMTMNNLDIETIQEFMEHPNKPEFIDWKDDYTGWTMLYCAVRCHRWDIAKLLLENGANVNIANYIGETALMLASRGCDNSSEIIIGVKLLLEYGADITMADGIGDTALILATQHGRTNVVKLLLEEGRRADINNIINISNRDGKTALMWASHHGYSDIMALLLLENNNKGAADNNVNIADNDGLTALMHACGSWAGEDELAGVAKLLVEKGGADIYILDKQGETALMKASERGYNDIVKLLLEKGADIKILNNDGKTALQKAFQYGHLETMKLLIKCGADSSFRVVLERDNEYESESSEYYESEGSDGESIIKEVRPKRRDAVRIVQNLLESTGYHDDSNPYSPSRVESSAYECTVLHWACLNNHFDIVQLLLLLTEDENNNGCRADIQAKDEYGMTALHLVCYLGSSSSSSSLDMVQFLLRHGANANTESKQGWTPLHLACNENHLDVVWCLLCQDPRLVAGPFE